MTEHVEFDADQLLAVRHAVESHLSDILVQVSTHGAQAKLLEAEMLQHRQQWARLSDERDRLQQWLDDNPIPAE